MVNMMTNKLYGPLELDRLQKIITKETGRTVVVGPPNFREGTELSVIKNSFVFAGAGMGDFICYMPAMLWIARNCPWIEGSIFCPSYFIEFAESVMRTAGFDWRAYDVLKIKELLPKRSILTGPGIEVNGHTNHQLFNGCGAHLVDVGFAYFANKLPVGDEERQYPQLEFSQDFKLKALLDFGADIFTTPYVVFTTGGTSPNRTVPGAHWNPIIDWVIENGMKPVFLGKSKMTDSFKVTFEPGTHYDKGIDLRDKTSMLEAAFIMKKAKCVLGFDNGLLHLAGCTDANVVAGFGSVDPLEREPYRKCGRWVSLVANLECIGCQTNMKKMFPHNFKYCLYKRETPEGPKGDTLCIDHLFADGAKPWIDAIRGSLN